MTDVMAVLNTVATLTETRDSHKHVVKIVIEKLRDMDNVNTPSKFKRCPLSGKNLSWRYFLKFLAISEMKGKTSVIKGNRWILKMFTKGMPYYF